MPYVTSWERMSRRQESYQKAYQEAYREGLTEGLIKGLQLPLEIKFGAEGIQLGLEIETITDVEVLRKLLEGLPGDNRATSPAS